MAGGAGGGGAGGAARFTLTSSAFVEGGDIPAAHTCGGADTSPPFAWMNPPAGTASFALTMTDHTPTIAVTQWAIFNIPASTSALPAAIPEDARILLPPLVGQQVSVDTGSPGYEGPCTGGATGRFLFRLYALDVAALPNVMETSPIADVVDEILDNLIAFADLNGRSDASAP
jgi:Raf kinase inhibitor-like YbhB/YbcL family protein